MARILGVQGEHGHRDRVCDQRPLCGHRCLPPGRADRRGPPDIGSKPVLYAFVATVLGGMGSLRGAVLGGYVFGAVSVALQATLPASSSRPTVTRSLSGP